MDFSGCQVGFEDTIFGESQIRKNPQILKLYQSFCRLSLGYTVIGIALYDVLDFQQHQVKCERSL
jgi:hypothetical protein